MINRKINNYEKPFFDLKNFWKHTSEKLLMKSIKYKDDGLKSILLELKKVPEEVIDHLLMVYLIQCRNRMHLAFN